jgi:hypothetical protein
MVRIELVKVMVNGIIPLLKLPVLAPLDGWQEVGPRSLNPADLIAIHEMLRLK